MEVLIEQGIGSLTERVTYGEVFRHLEKSKGIKITHASIHGRIWENQRAFQLELMARIASQSLPNVFDVTIAAAGEALAGGDFSTTAGRRRIIREVCRAAGPANLQVAVTEIERKLKRVLEYSVALGLADDMLDDIVIAPLKAGDAELGSKYEHFVAFMIDRVGLRLRAEYHGVEQPAVLFMQLASMSQEGIKFRRSLLGDQPVELATGPAGTFQDWDLFGLQLWHTAAGLFELDGDLDDAERSLLLLD